jgi:hypothetical protein
MRLTAQDNEASRVYGKVKKENGLIDEDNQASGFGGEVKRENGLMEITEHSASRVSPIRTFRRSQRMTELPLTR